MNTFMLSLLSILICFFGMLNSTNALPIQYNFILTGEVTTDIPTDSWLGMDIGIQQGTTVSGSVSYIYDIDDPDPSFPLNNPYDLKYTIVLANKYKFYNFDGDGHAINHNSIPSCNESGLYFNDESPYAASNYPIWADTLALSIINGAGDLFLDIVSSDFSRGRMISASMEMNPVPEPATIFLLGSGIACLAGVKRNRRQMDSLG